MVSKKISDQSLCSYAISAFPESFHLIFTSVLPIRGTIISLSQMKTLRHRGPITCPRSESECVVGEDLSPEQFEFSS